MTPALVLSVAKVEKSVLINKRTRTKMEVMNLGRYKIIEELGRGSFGTVYKAEDQTLIGYRDQGIAQSTHCRPGFIGSLQSGSQLAVRLTTLTRPYL